MPDDAVLLFTDATILRWFPPRRYTWAFRGEQAQVRITGRNAKRVLFAALNPRTGHRLVLRRFRQRQDDFQAFLRHTCGDTTAVGLCGCCWTRPPAIKPAAVNDWPPAWE
jgi:hypothetical protein